MKWSCLGDESFLATCEDEEEAIRTAEAARAMGAPWRQDVVQAYKTVAVFFDARQVEPTLVRACLESLSVPRKLAADVQGKNHIIPCCYEMGLDHGRIRAATRLAEEEIIRLHQGTIYTVYAIGFCPGFPYLGYLPAPLQGVPRLSAPRLVVAAGSVGLTGKQTGIYTEPRPGGWNIVGRTPLELVNVAEGYFPLRTGDRVRFRRIDEKEFADLRGERI